MTFMKESDEDKGRGGGSLKERFGEAVQGGVFLGTRGQRRAKQGGGESDHLSCNVLGDSRTNQLCAKCRGFEPCLAFPTGAPR